MIKLLEILKEVKETFENFATIRGKGAAKISEATHKKGGLALLTWHHFKVKLPYYKKAAAGKLDMEQLKKNLTKRIRKSLQTCLKLNSRKKWDD
jgi:hypothetical protein